jgi:hypothetical protein
MTEKSDVVFTNILDFSYSCCVKRVFCLGMHRYVQALFWIAVDAESTVM